jgi:general secretion pathway protein G
MGEIKMKTANIITILVIIIIILLFVVGPKFLRQSQSVYGGKWDKARPKMATLESAIDAFYLNSGQYPKTLDELLICPVGFEHVWAGPYLKKSSLYDEWGNMYIYDPNIRNYTSYNLISYGADGVPGGEGENTDISKLAIDTQEKEKIARGEKVEELKALAIKTSIIVGWFLSSIGTIAIYKYTKRPKTMHNSQ